MVALLRVNLARRIGDHLLGEEHPLPHRMKIGGCMMLIGVGIANLFQGYMFHFIPDMIGYLIHGAGTIPFIDWLTRRKHQEQVAEHVDPLKLSTDTTVPYTTVTNHRKEEVHG